MPMKILRDASTVLAAQTGRLEPQAPAKRERTPSGYNCPKANHRVKEQMMSKLSLKMKLAVGFGTLLWEIDKVWNQDGSMHHFMLTRSPLWECVHG